MASRADVSRVRAAAPDRAQVNQLTPAQSSANHALALPFRPEASKHFEAKDSKFFDLILQHVPTDDKKSDSPASAQVMAMCTVRAAHALVTLADSSCAQLANLFASPALATKLVSYRHVASNADFGLLCRHQAKDPRFLKAATAAIRSDNKVCLTRCCSC